MLIAVTMAVLMAAVVQIPVTDADTVQDDTYYCYGDHPKVQQKYEGDSEWTFESENGHTVETLENDDGTITIDLTGHDIVHVTQKVGEDFAKSTLVAMHLGEGTIVVNYHDRGTIIKTHYIDGSTVVREGELFAHNPEDPERDGHEFGGWYHDQTFTDEFDPYEVITEDIDVYAKWTATSGGTNESVSVGTYLVTFECAPGISYTIVDRSTGSVSFTVSEAIGADIVEDSIEVEANGIPVLPVNGVYTVSNIHSDMLITIDGEVVYSDNPNDTVFIEGDIPVWVWILVVIAIVLVVAAVAIYARSRTA